MSLGQQGVPAYNVWPAGGPSLGTLDATTSWIVQNLPTTQGAGLSLAAVQALCPNASGATVQSALNFLVAAGAAFFQSNVYWRTLL